MTGSSDTELWLLDLDTLELGPVTGRVADVVFAGAPQRAFVSVSQLNQVRVYDPADLAQAPTVLTIAGAVVTADGGAMSHAAVLSRELGIPAVIGAHDALTIADGATIEVDPRSGRVRIVDA